MVTLQGLGQLPAISGVEAGSWFVEKKYLWSDDENAGDLGQTSGCKWQLGDRAVRNG